MCVHRIPIGFSMDIRSNFAYFHRVSHAIYHVNYTSTLLRFRQQRLAVLFRFRIFIVSILIIREQLSVSPMRAQAPGFRNVFEGGGGGAEPVAYTRKVDSWFGSPKSGLTSEMFKNDMYKLNCCAMQSFGHLPLHRPFERLLNYGGQLRFSSVNSKYFTPTLA